MTDLKGFVDDVIGVIKEATEYARTNTFTDELNLILLVAFYKDMQLTILHLDK